MVLFALAMAMAVAGSLSGGEGRGTTGSERIMASNFSKETFLSPDEPEFLSRDSNLTAGCCTDCEVAASQAICNTSSRRKPDCEGRGAVCGDPRFVGGDGVMFYFHGKKDQDFCIVSDPKLHVNARFIGKRAAGRPRDHTWVRSLGIMFESHSLVVGAKKVAQWDENEDALVLTFDGKNIAITAHENALWASDSGNVVVERIAATNNIFLVILGLMELTLSIVPITQRESWIHDFQITKDDCFAHLQMQFSFFDLSPFVHGVLGQTYRPGFQTAVGPSVSMPLMSGEETYFTSSLLSSDCQASQFSAPAPVQRLSTIMTPGPIVHSSWTIWIRNLSHKFSMSCCHRPGCRFICSLPSRNA